MFFKGTTERELRLAIRKISFGATSVAATSLYLFMGVSPVSASETNSTKTERSSVAKGTNPTSNKDEQSTYSTEPTAVSSGLGVLDKTKLSSLIKEIATKDTNGAYASKTEESLAKLKVEVERAKTTVTNATTQDELTKAYNDLVTVTTQLKTKPEERKQVQAVDTTNGKLTISKKASNTEKKSESHSIANSGRQDPRKEQKSSKTALSEQVISKQISMTMPLCPMYS